MNAILTLLTAMIMSTTANADEQQQREVAAEGHTIETASVERSFFQPKTLEDINALVTLESELESSLNKEISN